MPAESEYVKKPSVGGRRRRRRFA